MTRPSREASPADDTRQRIIHSAAKVFSENGYARSTTRRLAQASGINEVTLFRHFKSKHHLFEAVVEQFGGPAVSAEVEARFSGNYREDLIQIGKYFMSLMVERSRMIRLMMCEAAHFPDLAAVMGQNPVLVRQVLARYLQGQIDRGVIKPVNTEAASQAFWGMFFAYGLGKEIYTNQVDLGLTAEQLVENFVDLFIHGTLR